MTKNKEQEFYINGKKTFIVNEFKYKNNTLVVCNNGDDWVEVNRKSELRKWEDTYEYKQEQEKKKRTIKIEKERNEIIEKIKKEAVESLVARIRLNVAFGTGDNCVGIVIAQALEKMIDDKNID